MTPPRLVLPTSTTAPEARALCNAADVPGAPIIDAAGRFEGTISLAELVESPEPKVTVGSLADAGAPAISLNSRLDTALESIASAHLSWVPVLDDDRHVVATLSVSDLVQAYRRELLASAERVGALGASAGAFEVSVTKDSTLAGQRLRSAGFPEGTLVTSIAATDTSWLRPATSSLNPGIVSGYLAKIHQTSCQPSPKDHRCL